MVLSYGLYDTNNFRFGSKPFYFICWSGQFCFILLLSCLVYWCEQRTNRQNKEWTDSGQGKQ